MTLFQSEMAPDAGEDDGERDACARIVATSDKLDGGKNSGDDDRAAQEDVSHAGIERGFFLVGLGEPHERKGNEGDNGGGD